MKTDEQIVRRNGKQFVLVPVSEYRRLKRLDDADLPRLPEPDKDGNYPAIEAMQVSLARGIIRDRLRLGLTQEELARRAGVRPETIHRVETGKHSPTVATVDKIDRALKEAESEAGDNGKGKRRRQRR